MLLGDGVTDLKKTFCGLFVSVNVCMLSCSDLRAGSAFAPTCEIIILGLQCCLCQELLTATALIMEQHGEKEKGKNRDEFDFQEPFCTCPECRLLILWSFLSH